VACAFFEAYLEQQIEDDFCYIFHLRQKGYLRVSPANISVRSRKKIIRQSCSYFHNSGPKMKEEELRPAKAY
jgi:hypothetical protein